VSALDDWRDALASWALPDEILTRTRRSPWEYPWDLFRRRAEAALTDEPTPSAERALEALPERGSVLDVGAGPGAASLALARRAGRIVAVDQSKEALTIFEELASRSELDHEVVVGTWPDIAARAPATDVVVCNHVLYNVAELEPFVGELTSHARGRVVAEITAEHPRAEDSQLWKRLYDLDRPTRPTADDAERALSELGVAAHRDDWTVTRPPEPRSELIDRLLMEFALEPEQEDELVDALADRLREVEGGWIAGPQERRLVTLWWDV
jgi:SAM-dependent methyltransferase